MSVIQIIFVPNGYLTHTTHVSNALKDPKWKAGMMEEMHACDENERWDIVDLSRGKYVVGCKQVYTLKYNPNDTMQRHKARNMENGFTHSYGMDCLETFPLVAKLN